MADAETRGDRCDFCRLSVTGDPVTTEHRGVTYHFCSESCRSALEAKEQVFTEYHGFRQFDPGVTAIDASLPQGMPRNSFVLLSGQSGTRDEAVQAELVWRALERGEPVVVVSFLETPTSIAQEFVTLEWNVLPYLESGQLQLVDCFTHRLDDRERLHDRMNDWNRHLQSVAETSTRTVRDPTNLSQVANRLDACLEAHEMGEEGLVVIDSLTELGSLVQPVKAYDFVKNLRAEVCKGRFVPVFAGATLHTNEEEFPHDLAYMVDGIVDLRFNSDLVEDTLLKQLRVRKLSGVLTVPEWHTYEFTSGTGQVVFDPEEQLEKAREERVGEEDGAVADEGTDGEGGTDGEDAEGEGETDGDGADAGAVDGDDAGGADGEETSAEAGDNSVDDGVDEEGVGADNAG